MTAGTMDAIMKIISWSFNALLDGRTPAKNHDGVDLPGVQQDLAGGWCGALAQVRGDWAFYTEIFYFGSENKPRTNK